MIAAVIAVFTLAYAVVALEHPLGINKAATALVGAGLMWTIYAVLADTAPTVVTELNDSVAATAQIIFFLIGAMTIVEVIDAHNGFEVVTSMIGTRNQVTLVWLIGIVTFFLSAMLDNLTTAIVMVSLMKKLSGRDEDRLVFAAIIVIAANAGGAWSAIGDVTTTMLWIGGQITPLAIMRSVFIASLLNLLVPLAAVSLTLRGKQLVPPATAGLVSTSPIRPFERNLMFFMGLGILVLVPLFKAVTHLPPFMGILFGLGLLWMVGEIIHRQKASEQKHRLTLVHALTRIDMPSIVFFIGILLAVAALEHTHVLQALAQWLDRTVGRLDLIVIVLGLASAVIDNVPLVAASMGMYGLNQYPPDSFIWEFVAYCAGTGGSILIIGSAAGVAAMGLENIHFFWYVRRISGIALLGYFAGAVAYIIQYNLIH